MLTPESPDADVQTKAPPVKPRGGARTLAVALPLLLLTLPAAVAQPDMVELCALNPPSQSPGLYRGGECRWTAGGDPADNLNSPSFRQL